jgi:cysteinyl-tRNA synthetase
MEVLDVLPTKKTVAADLSQWVEERISARTKARQSRDFKEADRIRAELKERGVEIEDTPGGTKWKT